MDRKWWKESVVYEIYPRSFMDSNGDGIGDINGIRSKLDYLKDLGVDVLWIAPIYASPMDDNGYDISDYRAIRPECGTMEDFDALLSEAHARGIKIVMDLVVNHTSDEHAWFVESRKSSNNPYRDYYIWKPGKNGGAPNNWGSCFGGSAWEYSPETDMYYLHLYSKKQPDLNWENPRVRDEVFDMMTWWFDKGIDGFRMDVISQISKDQSFPDGEKYGLYGNGGRYFTNGPREHEFLQEMNRRVLSKYDAMTVGEAPGATVENAPLYAGLDGKELSMVFQFEHVGIGDGPLGKWTTQRYDFMQLKEILSRWQTGLDGKAWNSLFWGNHDQPRTVSRWGDDSPISAKMLCTCLLTMQGTPYIYEGDELGMTNAYFTELGQYRDIESINAFREMTEAGLIGREEMLKCMALRSRDNSRTPMQWDDSPNAGFTSGTPWIEVNENYKQINVKAEMADPDSVYSYYKRMIALRKSHLGLIYGSFELLAPTDTQLFAYIRRLEETGEEYLIVCNFSGTDATLQVPVEYSNAKVLVSNYGKTDYQGMTTLRPYEAVVLEK